MLRKWTCLLGLAAVLDLSGCASLHPGVLSGAIRTPSRTAVARVGKYRAAVIPPLGMIYSSVSAPINSRARGTIGPKTGEATAYAIGLPPNSVTGWAGLDLISWGDMSAQRALQDGSITDLTHTDYEVVVVLMFFRKMKLITYGQ